ncbi:MAG: ECF transporter S component [Propionibacteriaceae bacterium]|jgi:energy-coupling factor transport system substrate-specific component|nr:ECF transporter S component [Propionibacteriaceae bacterium]
MRSSTQAVPITWKSGLLLAVLTLAGLAMFAWPLVLPADPGSDQHALEAPYLFMAILPLLVLLVLVQLTDGGMDAKALALLGVLSAVNAAIRPLGAGTNGVETVFFLLILAGRVLGPGFGFTLGCTSLFASALLTSGMGPWLPFQMLASAWVGMGAGLLPQRAFGKPLRGGVELALLAIYGAIAGYLYGILMNLWFWPYLVSGTVTDPGLAYIPGAPFVENLGRFVWYTLISSTAIWDTGRAITNIFLIVLLGTPVLTALRRASKRANFLPVVAYI